MTGPTHDDPDEGQRLAGAIGDMLRARGERLAVAESCTGGWIAKQLTDVVGSSDWFECGYVVYSHQAKARMLGVDVPLMVREGTVSRVVAVAEAQGALQRSGADWALSTTGVAGPGGATDAKPVGLVWMAWAWGSTVEVRREQFAGGRDAVRWQAVLATLRGLHEHLKAAGAG